MYLLIIMNIFFAIIIIAIVSIFYIDISVIIITLLTSSISTIFSIYLILIAQGIICYEIYLNSYSEIYEN